ncbi:signal transduction histidine kinase [Malaciobacter molluscorum LMG 25693]|uniref:histidine kinase n=1 Tax=Malaciobacter molluscorum LMG 25693 TaxID=870501 RepID=A0A2G1DJL7_9BACT|nr:histidine kinase dimerization/phosphoacceptor domain -containing protein [Malaciobacter molluscorum]AXX92848.1 PAS sensor-containing two-component system histidine kinase [Malaciobacter molluscorum LMG 25693]PHO18687.1 signal transduction histidine kinase [Malaciobacter molluscorum LMG 25693]
MLNDILNVIARIPNEKKAKLYSFSFLVIGILGIIIVNKLSIFIIQNTEHKDNPILPLLIGISFFIITSIFLYYFLKSIAKIEKEAKEKLIQFQKEESENLKLINFVLDNTADAIYWFRFNGSIVYVNNRLCKMLGYTKDELIGNNITIIDKKFSEIEKTIIRKERQYNYFESELTTNDGKTFPCFIAANYFSANENEEFVCAFARDITEQKRKENIIKSSLEEKEILIKEIHHRVKNNLQVLSSLLSMQKRRETNSEITNQLDKTRSRIYAIALVHEIIYQGDDLRFINMDQYLTKLSYAMKDIYNLDENIKIEISVSKKMNLGINYSVLTALVIHELLLNSIKHAFKNKDEGIISITIENNNDDVIFEVKDNGIGCDIEKLKNSNSLGWQLIESVVEFQLDGNLEISSKDGFSCRVTYKLVNNDED